MNLTLKGGYVLTEVGNTCQEVKMIRIKMQLHFTIISEKINDIGIVESEIQAETFKSY